MISVGLAEQQKHEHRLLNGKRIRNGLGQADQHIRKITALFQKLDAKPSADLGNHPELMWLPKTLLYVDARYQREANNSTARKLIKRIVEEFSWSKFQPITVAEMREGTAAGHYAVIDGQRRSIAALIHPNIVEVPCWIVDAAEVGLQARVFVGVNRDRTNIQPLQLYRAQIAAHDPDAQRIESICNSAGVTFAFHVPGHTNGRLPPGQTQAVSTIRRLLKRYGDGPVTSALKAIVTAFPDMPGQLKGQVIEAVATVFANHGPRVDVEHFISVLRDRDCEQLIAAARRFKNDLGGKTNVCMVAALIRFYNKSKSGSARLPAPQKL